MLITVIVTTYNSHKKLKKVIESLTIQSDSEFEIIIADDGSSEKHFDNTKMRKYEHCYWKFTKSRT